MSFGRMGGGGVHGGSGAGVGGGGDLTAPVLTNPTDASAGTSFATLTVDTDEANGTLYVVATTSSTAPSKARVKLGQDNSGVAAAYASSQAITTTGTKTFNATGLQSSTAYTAFFMHEDDSTNQSNVSSGNGFTTDAVAAPSSYVPTFAFFGF